MDGIDAVRVDATPYGTPTRIFGNLWSSFFRFQCIGNEWRKRRAWAGFLILLETL